MENVSIILTKGKDELKKEEKALISVLNKENKDDEVVKYGEKEITDLINKNN